MWDHLDAGPLSEDLIPAVLLAIGDELFVWGASGAWVLDAATDQWRAAAEPPTALRVFDAAVWTGHEVLLWGGHDATIGQPSTGAVYPDLGIAYDPATDRWRTLPQAPIATRHPAVFAWGAGEFFVWGGYRFDGPSSGPVGAPTARVLNDAAAYNPGTDTWRALASAVTTRTDTEPTLATGSPPVQWVTVPADVDNGFGATNHLITYHPDRDSWASEIASPMIGWSEAGSWTPSGFLAVATSVTSIGAPVAVETASWQPDRGWTVLAPPAVSQAVLCRTQVLHTVRSAVVRRCGDLAVLEPDLTWRMLPSVAESASVIALDTMLVAIDENMHRLRLADGP